MMDLATRTEDADFFDQLGEPLSQAHMDAAPRILHGLAQKTQGAIQAAHHWLETARVNHVAALLGHRNVDDADALDALEDWVEEHDLILPPRLEDVCNAYDVEGKLSAQQREQVHQFIAEHAFEARQQIGDTAGERLQEWMKARREQFNKWRGNRKTLIREIKEDIRAAELHLAELRSQLSKAVGWWRPFKRRKERRRARKAGKRAFKVNIRRPK